MTFWVPAVKFAKKQITLGGGKAKPKKTSAKPRPAKRWTIPAAGFFILVIACGFVWHTLSAPNHGNIAVISPDITSQTKLPEYTTLNTNYYSLNYSQRYNQVPTDVTPAGLLDQKILAYKLVGQPGQSKIQVDIKAAPDGGITLDSDYNYYVKHLAQYKLSNVFYHGETIDIARSQKGVAPEAAGLWLHGSYLMAVKITTADPHQNIDAELKDLLSSVQWVD